jgi:protein-tyrosine-phosphatase
MSEVLFVCRANVLRSKMAAAVWNYETGSNNATSAGLVLSHRHPIKNHIMHRDVRQVLAQGGIDIPTKELRPHRLTEQAAKNAGRIILLTRAYMPDFVYEHQQVEYWPVADPTNKESLEYAYHVIRGYIDRELHKTPQPHASF